MDVHLRLAFHPLLGRFRIGASRLRPLFPELHTSDYSFACPGSSTWVDKVSSRDTPTLNLMAHRGGMALDDPQVAQTRSYSRLASISVAGSEVTMKRGLASPWVHSALPMTRRMRLQLSRVDQRKSLKRRGGLAGLSAGARAGAHSGAGPLRSPGVRRPPQAKST